VRTNTLLLFSFFIYYLFSLSLLAMCKKCTSVSKCYKEKIGSLFIYEERNNASNVIRGNFKKEKEISNFFDPYGKIFIFCNFYYVVG